MHLEKNSTFSPYGGSLTVKKLPNVEKKVLKKFEDKKKSERLNKWNRKMGGRSHVITFDVFPV